MCDNYEEYVSPPNPYYSPSRFEEGFEVVGSLQEDHMSYEFNLFVVWKDKDGNLYCASDSGCSCPEPFERYTSKADLTYLDNFATFTTQLGNWLNAIYDAKNRPNETAKALIRKVADLL